MAGFQTTINVQPAPGIEGDFCSSNPRFSMLAGPGALVAGPNGVTVGRFAWADADGVVSAGGNGRIGFVHRSNISLIFPTAVTGANAWPGPQSGMLIPPGLEMSMLTSGDVWCRFASGATRSRSAPGKRPGVISTTETLEPNSW